MLILTEFEKKPLLFKDPEEIIACNNPADISKCFARMESAVSSGHYLAGFLSYEAGYAFEEKLNKNMDVLLEPETKVPACRSEAAGRSVPIFSSVAEPRIYSQVPDFSQTFPLLYFGVFKDFRKRPLDDLSNGSYKFTNAGLNIEKEKYFENIRAIRNYISEGDVYQITYCAKMLFELSGDKFSFYKKLKKEQPMPYSAYIETNDFTIMSLSPEMFLKKTGNFIKTKPMKGTWMRGNNYIEDILVPYKLHFDPKNRAENIMICDLLRNDIGRIGKNVRAPKLFEVAKYKTLCQMTSTVTGHIDKDIPLYDLFKALHPSGSVTGAPKIRAMEIINELENEERNIYTGAIGYITPDKDMFFNVPIRTLLVRNDHGEMGVGGGIVWDSTPEGELDEIMLKAKFLRE